MQALIIGLWWIVALVLAAILIYRARPQSSVERYRIQAYIKEVEPLTEKDTMRSLPYEVTVLLPSQDPDETNTYYYVTLNPEDLHIGRARTCARNHIPLPAWVSVVDSHDIRFENSHSWNTETIINAVLLLVAQFIMTGTCLVNLELVTNSDPYFVLLFPPTILFFAFAALYGLLRFGQAVRVWVRVASNPATVPASISGIRRISGHAGHPGGFEVSLMWAPLGMPAQYGKVRIPGFQRRTSLLLQKLVRTQLEEEAKGVWRVTPAIPQNQARPHTAVSELHTPQGPTTVKITALPPNDPRFDPRPPKVRAAAEKARLKREAELLAQREAFERATARARIEEANRAELGSEENSLDEVASQGPQAWYYPMNPSRVNLVGVGTDPGNRSNLVGPGIGWLCIALLAGLAVAWLGFINPDIMFPVYEAPSGDQPLGGWTR
ncbi:hypothetical protein [uncultured Mobiluncus sp.]|uniref:hypothetical protein n=1 Tax=uncultured Mobiluncus sp. TaxID=293425 RepID=UPI0025F601A3|nr:hypothetical protein [uncultured Mobiluncus sp.]